MRDRQCRPRLGVDPRNAEAHDGVHGPALRGQQVVLMYMDLTRKPVFLGPGHLVGALQGKGYAELKWQKAVLT
jgi:hypothetical protein